MTDGILEGAFYRALGQKIMLRRKTMRLSRQTLGAEIGIHRNVLGRYESGQNAIPVWMLLRVADRLECNFLTLLPSPEHTWGTLSPQVRERRKNIQSERDPPLTKKERTA